MPYEISVYVNPPEIIKSLGSEISRTVATMLFKQDNSICAICIMCRSRSDEYDFTTLVESETRIKEVEDAGHAIKTYYLVERSELDRFV